MQIIERPEEEGHQFDEVGGIDLTITDYDSSLLAGIEIDYQDSLMGGGFKIENPNANKACSCGSSFA
jgi:iron-sulfur cluster assembly protein